MSESDHARVLRSLPSQARCPRCGKPNRCAMEAGKSVSACWCFALPPAARIEAGEENDACLCRDCLTEEAKKA